MPDRTHPFLILQSIGKTFASGVTALDKVNLTVNDGDFMSLLGPSGCGKSTALRIIAGLSAPTQGVVDWRGPPLDQNDIGFVFQEPTLLPWASVYDNVWLPLRLRGMSRNEAEPQIKEVLERVHLTGFENAVPRELSGGMKMRVSIARGLVTKPRILLMDEPFAALDEITRFKLNNDLLELWQERRFTVIFVTHSVFEIRAGCLKNSLSRRLTRAMRSSEPPRTMPNCAAMHPTPCRAPWARRLPMPSIENAAVVIDADEARRERNRRMERTGRWLLPLIIMAAAVYFWDRICVWNEIPQYILPRPGVVLNTLIEDAGLLFSSLLVTLRITVLSLALAVFGGVGLSVLFTQSRWIEMSLFPFAIVLQVTPIVAIFPLINIYIDDQTTKLLLCAWIVAFFPILSNTTLGLNSVDRNLIDYFKLNGATRWQTLWHLRLPAAMPYFLGGLKIAGGLALIGAVVAEFVAGTAGQSSGLASRIIEAGYRLNAPRLFAALILISLTGIVIFLTLSWISHLVLHRWHESALKQEQ